MRSVPESQPLCRLPFGLSLRLSLRPPFCRSRSNCFTPPSWRPLRPSLPSGAHTTQAWPPRRQRAARLQA